MKIQKVNFKSIEAFTKKYQVYHSWDNVNQAILLAEKIYDCYLVKNDQDETIAYFVINPKSGYVPQMESLDGNFKNLLHGISQIKPGLRLNNVDVERKQRIDDLLLNDFENQIDQFEMEMEV